MGVGAIPWVIKAFPSVNLVYLRHVPIPKPITIFAGGMLCSGFLNQALASMICLAKINSNMLGWMQSLLSKRSQLETLLRFHIRLQVQYLSVTSSSWCRSLQVRVLSLTTLPRMISYTMVENEHNGKYSLGGGEKGSSIYWSLVQSMGWITGVHVLCPGSHSATLVL